MAYVSTSQPGATARDLGARLMAWLESYAHRRSRRDRIEALLALPDAELAARGLTRDRIVAHVFSDRLGL